jgi:hypothetical protein
LHRKAVAVATAQRQALLDEGDRQQQQAVGLVKVVVKQLAELVSWQSLGGILRGPSWCSGVAQQIATDLGAGSIPLTPPPPEPPPVSTLSPFDPNFNFLAEFGSGLDLLGLE